MAELTKGQIFTRDCEGTYDKCDHPHVPSTNSGVTLGFGCDLAARSHDEIYNLLRRVGVSKEDAYTFKDASGLRGNDAKQFLEDEGLEDFHLDHYQIDMLFQFTYGEIEKSARRIYSKPGCEEKYGWILSWHELKQKIRDIIIDLRYRGDWTPNTREFLAIPIRENDLRKLTSAMSDEDFWNRVPKDRFQRRIKYLGE